jgi:hypothetical protein
VYATDKENIAAVLRGVGTNVFNLIIINIFVYFKSFWYICKTIIHEDKKEYGNESKSIGAVKETQTVFEGYS